MDVLVFCYDGEIKGWLINEPIESVEEHIRNGYPELLELWKSGKLIVKVIDVNEEDAYKSDIFEVVNRGDYVDITKKLDLDKQVETGASI